MNQTQLKNYNFNGTPFHYKILIFQLFTFILNQSMLSKVIRKLFSTIESELLSTKNIQKFLVGDFPNALNYSRPFNMTTTRNGVVVASQKLSSKISTISVFIKCGSRNQTQKTSGTAHFLEHLHFKGTKNRTRTQLELQVENMGGNLNAYTSRQNTCYMINAFNKDLSKAISIVGDMITNSLYRKQDVQNERSTIKRQLYETRKAQPLQTNIEIAHRGIFQNQQIGLPILGSIQNMESISKQMIEHYHNTNYVGENIIVVGAGDINHDELHNAVQRYIQVQPKTTQKKALVKPKFFSGMTALQSDFTQSVNFVAVSQAPSFFDNQFFSYLLLQRIVSDRPGTQLQLEIMKNSSSFRFQKHLAHCDFIDRQKGFYSSYWDTGVYGNYFHCQPSKVMDVIKLNLEGYQNYANKVTDQQLQRAKRRVFVQILQHQTQNDLTQALGNNIMYYNRRVCMKQLAQRVSVITNEQIQKVAKRLVEKSDDMHYCFWGNVKKLPFTKK